MALCANQCWLYPVFLDQMSGAWTIRIYKLHLVSTSVHPQLVLNITLFSGRSQVFVRYVSDWMNLIWVNFPWTGKMVKMWHFFNFELCCDYTL